MSVLRERRRASWQEALMQGFSDAKDLLDYLSIERDLADNQAEQSFKTRVPLSFVQRMKKGDPHDPLLLQVLATVDERLEVDDFERDPLKEKDKNPVAGLIHKYHGRVLLTVAGSCAINCRYCFRRHFDYADNQLTPMAWDAISDYIESNPDIHEVILSGGDPLMLNDRAFDRALRRLSGLSQIKTIRIHSRMPIVLPERVNHSLVDSIVDTGLNAVMVVHCNHPNEVNSEVRQAMQRLATKGIHCLNQSVLLKGVNDSLDTLVALSHQLFEAGVMPYYLHRLDRVKGAAHFDIHREQAIQLHRQMQGLLPGYLVPKLVEEIAGESAKSLIS